jgi:hypothetical protein
MSDRKLRITAITLLAAAVAGAGLALIVRDQMSRHRRNLFSPAPLRRLAALGYMSREDATVDNITLLRDFIAWEPRKLLRNRAKGIVDRMEREARTPYLDGGEQKAG